MPKPTDEPTNPQPPTWVVHQPAIESLIDILTQAGYRVVGPRVDQHAIVYDDIQSIDDLPQNRCDTQAPGLYQLSTIPNQSNKKLFHYNVGPHSWKKFLFPPNSILSPQKTEDPSPKPLAILGARACELAAIAIQDRVFINDHYTDSNYQLRRKDLFVIAVQCTTLADTCFCSSMNTGPKLPPTTNQQFDLALTELPDASYLLRVGSTRGQEIATILFNQHPPQPASHSQLESERQAIDHVESNMKRSLPTENLKENLLKQLQNPHWDDVASRCLSCANCTMVCPTCFCSSVDEVHDLTDESIVRQRRWDSCFNPDFSHTSGAPVRNTIRSRYRQWVTHKLATWFDQFGSSGCVGCGRCITWCPVGIDLTAEVAKLVAPTSEPNAQ